MPIKSRLREFILKNFYVADPAELAETTSLLDRGIVDSTGVLELTAFLEDAFKITVADEDLIPENLDSLAKIEAYVSRKLAAA